MTQLLSQQLVDLPAQRQLDDSVALLQAFFGLFLLAVSVGGLARIFGRWFAVLAAAAIALAGLAMGAKRLKRSSRKRKRHRLRREFLAERPALLAGEEPKPLPAGEVEE